MAPNSDIPKPKRGRPRAFTLNPDAFDDALRRLDQTKSWLCRESGVAPGQLGDALGARRKGLSERHVVALAEILRCEPGTLAPEMSGRFVGVRPQDEAVAS